MGVPYDDLGRRAPSQQLIIDSVRPTMTAAVYLFTSPYLTPARQGSIDVILCNTIMTNLLRLGIGRTYYIYYSNQIKSKFYFEQ